MSHNTYLATHVARYNSTLGQAEFTAESGNCEDLICFFTPLYPYTDRNQLNDQHPSDSNLPNPFGSPSLSHHAMQPDLSSYGLQTQGFPNSHYGNLSPAPADLMMPSTSRVGGSAVFPPSNAPIFQPPVPTQTSLQRSLSSLSEQRRDSNHGVKEQQQSTSTQPWNGFTTASSSTYMGESNHQSSREEFQGHALNVGQSHNDHNRQPTTTAMPLLQSVPNKVDIHVSYNHHQPKSTGLLRNQPHPQHVVSTSLHSSHSLPGAIPPMESHHHHHHHSSSSGVQQMLGSSQHPKSIVQKPSVRTDERLPSYDAMQHSSGQNYGPQYYTQSFPSQHHDSFPNYAQAHSGGLDYVPPVPSSNNMMSGNHLDTHSNTHGSFYGHAHHSTHGEIPLSSSSPPPRSKHQLGHLPPLDRMGNDNPSHSHAHQPRSLPAPYQNTHDYHYQIQGTRLKEAQTTFFLNILGEFHRERNRAYAHNHAGDNEHHHGGELGAPLDTHSSIPLGSVTSKDATIGSGSNNARMHPGSNDASHSPLNTRGDDGHATGMSDGGLTLSNRGDDHAHQGQQAADRATVTPSIVDIFPKDTFLTHPRLSRTTVPLQRVLPHLSKLEHIRGAVSAQITALNQQYLDTFRDFRSLVGALSQSIRAACSPPSTTAPAASTITPHLSALQMSPSISDAHHQPHLPQQFSSFNQFPSQFLPDVTQPNLQGIPPSIGGAILPTQSVSESSDSCYSGFPLAVLEELLPRELPSRDASIPQAGVVRQQAQMNPSQADQQSSDPVAMNPMPDTDDPLAKPGQEDGSSLKAPSLDAIFAALDDNWVIERMIPNVRYIYFEESIQQSQYDYYNQEYMSKPMPRLTASLHDNKHPPKSIQRSMSHTAGLVGNAGGDPQLSTSGHGANTQPTANRTPLRPMIHGVPAENYLHALLSLPIWGLPALQTIRPGVLLRCMRTNELRLYVYGVAMQKRELSLPEVQALQTKAATLVSQQIQSSIATDEQLALGPSRHVSPHDNNNDKDSPSLIPSESFIFPSSFSSIHSPSLSPRMTTDATAARYGGQVQGNSGRPTRSYQPSIPPLQLGTVPPTNPLLTDPSSSSYHRSMSSAPPVPLLGKAAEGAPVSSTALQRSSPEYHPALSQYTFTPEWRCVQVRLPLPFLAPLTISSQSVSVEHSELYNDIFTSFIADIDSTCGSEITATAAAELPSSLSACDGGIAIPRTLSTASTTSSVLNRPVDRHGGTASGAGGAGGAMGDASSSNQRRGSLPALDSETSFAMSDTSQIYPSSDYPLPPRPSGRRSRNQRINHPPMYVIDNRNRMLWFKRRFKELQSLLVTTRETCSYLLPLRHHGSPQGPNESLSSNETPTFNTMDRMTSPPTDDDIHSKEVLFGHLIRYYRLTLSAHQRTPPQSSALSLPSAVAVDEQQASSPIPVLSDTMRDSLSPDSNDLTQEDGTITQTLFAGVILRDMQQGSMSDEHPEGPKHKAIRSAYQSEAANRESEGNDSRYRSTLIAPQAQNNTPPRSSPSSSSPSSSSPLSSPSSSSSSSSSSTANIDLSHDYQSDHVEQPSQASQELADLPQDDKTQMAYILYDYVHPDLTLERCIQLMQDFIAEVTLCRDTIALHRNEVEIKYTLCGQLLNRLEAMLQQYQHNYFHAKNLLYARSHQRGACQASLSVQQQQQQPFYGSAPTTGPPMMPSSSDASPVVGHPQYHQQHHHQQQRHQQQHHDMGDHMIHQRGSENLLWMDQSHLSMHQHESHDHMYTQTAATDKTASAGVKTTASAAQAPETAHNHSLDDEQYETTLQHVQHMVCHYQVIHNQLYAELGTTKQAIKFCDDLIGHPSVAIDIPSFSALEIDKRIFELTQQYHKTLIEPKGQKPAATTAAKGTVEGKPRLNFVNSRLPRTSSHQAGGAATNPHRHPPSSLIPHPGDGSSFPAFVHPIPGRFAPPIHPLIYNIPAAAAAAAAAAAVAGMGNSFEQSSFMNLPTFQFPANIPTPLQLQSAPPVTHMLTTAAGGQSQPQPPKFTITPDLFPWAPVKRRRRGVRRSPPEDQGDDTMGGIDNHCLELPQTTTASQHTNRTMDMCHNPLLLVHQRLEISTQHFIGQSYDNINKIYQRYKYHVELVQKRFTKLMSLAEKEHDRDDNSSDDEDEDGSDDDDDDGDGSRSGTGGKKDWQDTNSSAARNHHDTHQSTDPNLQKRDDYHDNHAGNSRNDGRHRDSNQQYTSHGTSSHAYEHKRLEQRSNITHPQHGSTSHASVKSFQSLQALITVITHHVQLTHEEIYSYLIILQFLFPHHNPNELASIFTAKPSLQYSFDFPLLHQRQHKGVVPTRHIHPVRSSTTKPKPPTPHAVLTLLQSYARRYSSKHLQPTRVGDHTHIATGISTQPIILNSVGNPAQRIKPDAMIPLTASIGKTLLYEFFSLQRQYAEKSALSSSSGSFRSNTHPGGHHDQKESSNSHHLFPIHSTMHDSPAIASCLDELLQIDAGSYFDLAVDNHGHVRRKKGRPKLGYRIFKQLLDSNEWTTIGLRLYFQHLVLYDVIASTPSLLLHKLDALKYLSYVRGKYSQVLKPLQMRSPQHPASSWSPIPRSVFNNQAAIFQVGPFQLKMTPLNPYHPSKTSLNSQSSSHRCHADHVTTLHLLALLLCLEANSRRHIIDQDALGALLKHISCALSHLDGEKTMEKRCQCYSSEDIFYASDNTENMGDADCGDFLHDTISCHRDVLQVVQSLGCINGSSTMGDRRPSPDPTPLYHVAITSGIEAATPSHNSISIDFILEIDSPQHHILALLVLFLILFRVVDSTSHQSEYSSIDGVQLPPLLPSLHSTVVSPEHKNDERRTQCGRSSKSDLITTLLSTVSAIVSAISIDLIMTVDQQRQQHVVLCIPQGTQASTPQPRHSHHSYGFSSIRPLELLGTIFSCFATVSSATHTLFSPSAIGQPSSPLPRSRCMSIVSSVQAVLDTIRSTTTCHSLDNDTASSTTTRRHNLNDLRFESKLNAADKAHSPHRSSGEIHDVFYSLQQFSSTFYQFVHSSLSVSDDRETGKCRSHSYTLLSSKSPELTPCIMNPMAITGNSTLFFTPTRNSYPPRVQFFSSFKNKRQPSKSPTQNRILPPRDEIPPPAKVKRIENDGDDEKDMTSPRFKRRRVLQPPKGTATTTTQRKRQRTLSRAIDTHTKGIVSLQSAQEVRPHHDEPLTDRHSDDSAKTAQGLGLQGTLEISIDAYLSEAIVCMDVPTDSDAMVFRGKIDPSLDEELLFASDSYVQQLYQDRMTAQEYLTKQKKQRDISQSQPYQAAQTVAIEASRVEASDGYRYDHATSHLRKQSSRSVTGLTPAFLNGIPPSAKQLFMEVLAHRGVDLAPIMIESKHSYETIREVYLALMLRRALQVDLAKSSSMLSDRLHSHTYGGHHGDDNDNDPQINYTDIRSIFSFHSLLFECNNTMYLQAEHIDPSWLSGMVATISRITSQTSGIPMAHEVHNIRCAGGLQTPHATHTRRDQLWNAFHTHLERLSASSLRSCLKTVMERTPSVVCVFPGMDTNGNGIVYNGITSTSAHNPRYYHWYFHTQFAQAQIDVQRQLLDTGHIIVAGSQRGGTASLSTSSGSAAYGLDSARSQKQPDKYASHGDYNAPRINSNSALSDSNGNGIGNGNGNGDMTEDDDNMVYLIARGSELPRMKPKEVFSSVFAPAQPWSPQSLVAAILSDPLACSDASLVDYLSGNRLLICPLSSLARSHQTAGGSQDPSEKTCTMAAAQDDDSSRSSTVADYTHALPLSDSCTACHLLCRSIILGLLSFYIRHGVILGYDDIRGMETRSDTDTSQKKHSYQAGSSNSFASSDRCPCEASTLSAERQALQQRRVTLELQADSQTGSAKARIVQELNETQYKLECFSNRLITTLGDCRPAQQVQIRPWNNANRSASNNKTDFMMHRHLSFGSASPHHHMRSFYARNAAHLLFVGQLCTSYNTPFAHIMELYNFILTNSHYYCYNITRDYENMNPDQRVSLTQCAALDDVYLHPHLAAYRLGTQHNTPYDLLFNQSLVAPALFAMGHYKLIKGYQYPEIRNVMATPPEYDQLWRGMLSSSPVVFDNAQRYIKQCTEYHVAKALSNLITTNQKPSFPCVTLNSEPVNVSGAMSMSHLHRDNDNPGSGPMTDDHNGASDPDFQFQSSYSPLFEHWVGSAYDKSQSPSSPKHGSGSLYCVTESTTASLGNIITSSTRSPFTMYQILFGFNMSNTAKKPTAACEPVTTTAEVTPPTSPTTHLQPQNTSGSSSSSPTLTTASGHQPIFPKQHELFEYYANNMDTLHLRGLPTAIQTAIQRYYYTTALQNGDVDTDQPRHTRRHSHSRTQKKKGNNESLRKKRAEILQQNKQKHLEKRRQAAAQQHQEQYHEHSPNGHTESTRQQPSSSLHPPRIGTGYTSSIGSRESSHNASHLYENPQPPGGLTQASNASHIPTGPQKGRSKPILRFTRTSSPPNTSNAPPAVRPTSHTAADSNPSPIPDPIQYGFAQPTQQPGTKPRRKAGRPRMDSPTHLQKLLNRKAEIIRQLNTLEQSYGSHFSSSNLPGLEARDQQAAQTHQFTPTPAGGYIPTPPSAIRPSRSETLRFNKICDTITELQSELSGIDSDLLKINAKQRA